MDHEIHDSEIEFMYDKKLLKQGGFAITDFDIEHHRQGIIRDFNRENIEVTYRFEIQKQLSAEKGYADLIKSINVIFSNNDEGALLD